MPSFNFAALIGHLGKDPEMSYTPKGTAMTRFSLAVADGWGENKRTDWFSVSCFGKQAEWANTGLHKGDLALVQGKVHVFKYEDKDGNTKYTTNVTADQVLSLSPRGEKVQTIETPEEQEELPF